MSQLPIELGVLDARHGSALGLHLLALNADDRYARFGHSLGDRAVLDWVRRIDWHGQRWMGAWTCPEGLLVGVVQLARTRLPHRWELAVSVAAPMRQRGLCTELLAAALQAPALRACDSLACHHGHPALTGVARRLGWRLGVPLLSPGALLLRPCVPGRFDGETGQFQAIRSL